MMNKIQFNYPFVGETNPIVLLHLYNVIDHKIVTDANEALNPAGKQDKHYITSVSFPNSLVPVLE